MKPGAPRRLSIPRLFLVTILLKIAASVAGWLLGSPWALGFATPLALMGLYIVLGLKRADDRVSDEKFADSCYYLGFIFTISSILVALFDIPSISTKIGEISVRFGAAMVSTVLGLIVRVYLVNFRPDFEDAKEAAETGLFDSVRVFRAQLDSALERLREFQRLVDDAAKASVAQVDLAIQDAAADHSQRFAELFEGIADSQRKAAADAAAHLRATTQTLSGALQDYAQALASGADRFEAGAAAFSESLEARLRRVALPEDFFTSRLSPPVERLGRAVAEVGGEVSSLSSEFQSQTRSLSAALDGVAAKTQVAAASMDRISSAVLDRAEVLNQGREQIEAFAKLAGAIAVLEQNASGSASLLRIMEQTLRMIVEDARKLTDANREIGRLAQRQAELTASVEQGIGQMLPRLQEADARVSGHLNQAIHAFDRSALRVSSALARQETALAQLSERLETLVDRLAAADRSPVRFDRAPPPIRRGGSET
jgi:hypothetical protein